MSDRKDSQESADPVYVIENIPVAGEHEVSPVEIAREGVPTPPHLRLFREIGRGGMGRIHPATDRNLLRHVALKRLDRELAKVPMYKDGFIAEAQMTGQLEHPNIVPVHELAVSDEGVPYFTMKLVQGINFDDWLRDPFRAPGSTARLEEGLEIFLKVCDAVAYAHHRGVIHRDLKPENVMVADFGQTYLMDWGLAKLTRSKPASGSSAQMEAPGPVGTPTHMAPEQARGNPAEMDERSDVFGLGAILYEIVSGKLPYGEAQDVDAVLKRAEAGKIVPIDVACMGIGVSKRIRSIVERAVSVRPEDRHESVVELQSEVRTFLRGGLHLPRRVFPPGSVIIREGDVGEDAYMIVSGRCQVMRRVGDQQELITTMGAGDVFGEMALLLSEPRAATVVAEDNVTVLVLDQRTLSAGLGADGWTGALVRALAQRFRDLEHTIRESGVRRG
ncbi:MAG: cyclic nucleotide-binding domain-containing protein [Myxococcales bacterium]|nr:MAG: cyclic nucleotide-binding domain-containing protein [Myxococcales bacterium]